MTEGTRTGIVSPRPKGGGMSIGTVEPEPRSRAPRTATETPTEGFATGPALFDRGVEAGEGKRSRVPWQDLPLLIEACEEHAAAIGDEQRDDSVALVTSSRMQGDGSLLVSHADDRPGAPPQRYLLTEDAFASLVTRINVPGAGRYLRTCWPDLRAVNVNGWIGRLSAAELAADAAAKIAGRVSQYIPLDMRLRHRLPSRGAPVDTREIFAVVGPAYADLDADKLDEVLRVSVDGSSRGRVTYDGTRTRWEILLDRPTYYGWRAGVVLTTDDTGGGAISGSAIVRQDEALDTIAVRTSTTATFSVRHIGDLDALALKVRAGIDRVLGAVHSFGPAWELANAEAIIPPHGIEGVFRDLMHREIVPIRGQRETIIRELAAEWKRGTLIASSVRTRAAIIRAIAHWVHATADLDPWAEDEVQAGLGTLLRRTKKGDGWAVTLGSLAAEDAR